MKNKILLIEPPFYRLYKDSYSLTRYPLALGYLSASILKDTNWDVMAYNADFNPLSEELKTGFLVSDGFDNYLNNLDDLSVKVWQEVRNTLEENQPTVVGISSKTQNYAAACNVARLVKEYNKDITVIVGGPHASMVKSEILDFPDIDIAVKGEGELTIVDLLNTIELGKELNEVTGIIYRNNGKVVENGPRAFTADLDELGFPHQTAPLVLKDYQHYPLEAFQYVFAIRGCPYECLFCGSREIWTRKARYRSAQNVIEEIKALQELGLNHIHFDDDTWGMNKNFVHDLCKGIRTECPGMRWSCELVVKLAKAPFLKQMSDAGCTYIQIGVESGNNEMLKKIKKSCTLEEAIAAGKLILKYNIGLLAFFMIGHPEETEETLNDTINAMKNFDCDIAFSIFTPYPGTEAFELCKKMGVIGDDYNVSLYNHQSPANNFCPAISAERFRELAIKTSKAVDRRNAINRVKRVFTLNNLIRKVNDDGIIDTIGKGGRYFIDAATEGLNFRNRL